MKEITDVLNAVKAPRSERARARQAFLSRREQIWQQIYDGKLPSSYVSGGGKKFVGAPASTALRCDFLLACKLALARDSR